MPSRIAAVLSGVALAACSVVGVREAEEPKYTLVERIGAIEIRTYGRRIAAETVVSGDEISARSTGFRRLAGYIFGGNTTGTKIEMTAPVAQDTAKKIAMTAPVAQDALPGGAWRIRFFMPASFTLTTLPKPNHSAVALAEVPGDTMAVLRFTGARDGDAIAVQERALMTALGPTKWRANGTVVAWFYDPPWTLPFLRRNEVAVPVRGRCPGE